MFGHAVHFLKRLKRADETESELAIQLYQQPQTVRMILLMLSPPPHVTRLAISIAPEDEGPFIVVERDGRFVTCLGRGMKTGGLFLVSFERFQVYLAKVRKLQSRNPKSNLSPMENRASDDDELFQALYSSEACREDIAGVSVLQPALKLDMIGHMKVPLDGLHNMESLLILHKKLPRKKNLSLKLYWDLIHDVANTVAIVSMFGPHGLERSFNFEPMGFPLQVGFDYGQLRCAARSIFAAAKLGRLAIPVCRYFLSPKNSPMEWLFAITGLLAIGIRHQKLKSQAHRILQKAFRDNTKTSSSWVRWYQAQLGEEFYRLVLRVMADEAGVYEENLQNQRRLWDELYSQRPGANNVMDIPAGNVSDRDVLAAGVNEIVDIRLHPKSVLALVAAIPWLARAEAEDLYLPREMSASLSPKWGPKWDAYIFDNLRQWYIKREPRKAPVQVGRNAPCPCGGGQKYKKCCMIKNGTEGTTQASE